MLLAPLELQSNVRVSALLGLILVVTEVDKLLPKAILGFLIPVRRRSDIGLNLRLDRAKHSALALQLVDILIAAANFHAACRTTEDTTDDTFKHSLTQHTCRRVGLIASVAQSDVGSKTLLTCLDHFGHCFRNSATGCTASNGASCNRSSGATCDFTFSGSFSLLCGHTTKSSVNYDLRCRAFQTEAPGNAAKTTRK